MKKLPSKRPEVLDISDTEEGVSKTSEAETLSGTWVSKNKSEVSDTASGIKGTPSLRRTTWIGMTLEGWCGLAAPYCVISTRRVQILFGKQNKKATLIQLDEAIAIPFAGLESNQVGVI